MVEPDGFISPSAWAALPASNVEPWDAIKDNAEWLGLWNTYASAQIEHARQYWEWLALWEGGKPPSSVEALADAAKDAQTALQNAINDGEVGRAVAGAYLAAGVQDKRDIDSYSTDMMDEAKKSYDAERKVMFGQLKDFERLVVDMRRKFTIGVREMLIEAAKSSSGVINDHPVISYTGSYTINVLQGDAAPDLLAGVTATDDQDGDLTASIVVDDDGLDMSEVGSYTIVYSVTDSNGSESSNNRMVQVEPDVNSLLASDLPVPTLDGFDSEGRAVISTGEISLPFNPNHFYYADSNGDRYFLELKTGWYRFGDTSNVVWGSSVLLNANASQWTEDENGRFVSPGWTYAMSCQDGTPENYTNSSAYGKKIYDGDTYWYKLDWRKYNQNTYQYTDVHNSGDTLSVSLPSRPAPTFPAIVTTDVSFVPDNLRDNPHNVAGILDFEMPWRFTQDPSSYMDSGNRVVLDNGDTLYAQAHTRTKVFRDGEQIAWSGWSQRWGSDYTYVDLVDDGNGLYQITNGGTDTRTLNFWNHSTQELSYEMQWGDTVRLTHGMVLYLYDADGNYVASLDNFGVTPMVSEFVLEEDE
tara:strand:+ start:1083 stop:2834 length:1752 start_codon:yes stop_codon:yes gene_type:complete